MAVSALSAVSNSTTPLPLERPLGSYWISARLTSPIVENRSTRSSLLVDQGSFDLSVSVHKASQSQAYIPNMDNWISFSTSSSKVGKGIRRDRLGTALIKPASTTTGATTAAIP